MRQRARTLDAHAEKTRCSHSHPLRDMRADVKHTRGGYSDEDTELMLRLRQGDSAAFGVLYARYLLPATAYAASLGGHGVSVADVVQEAFTRLWDRRREYRGEAGVRTYIFAYVRNICLEERRLRQKARVLSQYLSSACSPGGATSSLPEAAACRKERKEFLEQALAKLSKAQKQALQLYYIEGMSLREAAVSAGCTQKCLESRLSRGLAELRRLFPHAQP